MILGSPFYFDCFPLRPDKYLFGCKTPQESGHTPQESGFLLPTPTVILCHHKITLTMKNLFLTALFGGCILFFCPYFGYGQVIFYPDSIRKELKSARTQENLRLNGKLDEKAWLAAPAVSNFTQVEPFQGQKSIVQTFIKTLYDEKNLYFGVFCKDTARKGTFKAPDLKRDFAWRAHDMVAIGIDGFNDKRNSMTFAFNAYEAQKDYLSFDDTFFDADWNGLWQVRTSRTDSGWVAEVVIPWKTLRYKKSTDSLQSLGINLLRMHRSANEISVWSAYPRSFGFNRIEYGGNLTNLKPPPPNASNVQVQPYFLYAFDEYKTNQVNTGIFSKPKIGGEIKWVVNPNTVLDLTFNTDFAQADTDVQVNNITRFSVFFPERRSFFLENASLFGIGISPNQDMSGGNMQIQPFFSRRIGLDDFGNPIPIDVGARMVYRSLKYNAGGMVVRQREQGESPLTHFAIGRYSQNIGKQNRIGLLTTLKVVDSHGLTNAYSNGLWGIDGFFRLGNAKSINAMLMQSVNTNSQSNGFSGYAQYLYNTNQWKFWWTQTLVSKNFNPEVGFVSRQDVVGTATGFYYYHRGKKPIYQKLIRSLEPSISAELYHQSSTGELVERSISFLPLLLNLQSGGYVRFSVMPTFQNLLTPFAPLGVNIATGKYDYNRYSLGLGSNNSKKVSYTFQYDFGSYFNGSLQTTDLQVVVAPLPHISLRMRYYDNKFSEVGEEKTNTSVTLYNIEGRFAINPRVQLIGLFQYNTQNNRQSYNIRFAWEYKPLSYIYLIYNTRAFETINLQPNRTILQNQEQHLIAKISFLKQF